MKTNPTISKICACVLAMLACSCNSKQTVVTVHNDSAMPRVNEIVEISPAPAQLLSDGYVIVDGQGQQVPYQITYDGKLIFPATVAENSESKYYIKEGEPQEFESVIAYVYRPDCQDDFAWENDHSGYRLYGPDFKRRWGNVHGYDIWCKRQAQPIVKQFYDLDHGPEHISYHKDHGQGFDGYTVGPTLGAGACALVLDSTLCYPTAYDKYEVLDNGPLRLTVLFTVDSIKYGDKYVTEQRTLSLDAGDYFNRVSTVYQGVDSAKVAAGIVVHKDNPQGFEIIEGSDAIAVVDLSDNLQDNNGEIYVGAVVPGAQEISFIAFPEVKANAVGQVVATLPYSAQQPFVYYWGSGWNKNSVTDAQAWKQCLEQKKQSIDQPLRVDVSK